MERVSDAYRFPWHKINFFSPFPQRRSRKTTVNKVEKSIIFHANFQWKADARRKAESFHVFRDQKFGAFLMKKAFDDQIGNQKGGRNLKFWFWNDFLFSKGINLLSIGSMKWETFWGRRIFSLNILKQVFLRIFFLETFEKEVPSRNFKNSKTRSFFQIICSRKALRNFSTNKSLQKSFPKWNSMKLYELFFGEFSFKTSNFNKTINF